MSNETFSLLRRQEVPSLNLTVEEYRHRVTGARHFHLAAEDDNNAFLVAFLTVPTDSTGVAHILEHTTLCGSQRYPVRDPFFMMVRRSLNTFMNAFTASDWTAYPFASCNRKDFHNLLQVYLDATFFPLLNPLDFSQEGHRVEPEDATNPDSGLIYKGVVYNEMKGAMSAPSRRLAQTLQSHLFPTITYHHNSGGEPEVIPNLTHDQLVDFHRRHYHPSNAVFMTYGDLPVAQHHAWFEEYALSRFTAQPMDLAVPDERRYPVPLTVEAPYALEPTEKTARRTHVVVGWLLRPCTDPLDYLTAHLLSGVLLDNSASPLLRALETSNLGSAPSELCGLDDSSREMTFSCGLEGSERKDAAAVEELVLSVLREVVEHGVPRAHVDAVLHQLELSQREILGGGFPYGLRLLVNTLGRTLHGGDPIAALDIDPALAELHRRVEDESFIPNLVRTWLLENPHRVRVALYPDTELDAYRRTQEQERLAHLGATLDAAGRTQLIEQAQQLAARQGHSDDPELLPRVGLADVPADLRIAEGERIRLAGMPAAWYGQGTNGLVYQQIILDLPVLDPGQIDDLPLFSECLTEVGSAGRDYLTTQSLQAAVTGGIRTAHALRATVDDVTQTRGLFVISGKALTRNHAALTHLLWETLFDPRFNELDRLRELVAQSRLSRESSVTDHGHVLAMVAAAAGLSAVARLSHRWGGLLGLVRLKALDDRLDDDGELEAFAARLAFLAETIAAAPRRLLLVGEDANRDAVLAAATSVWAGNLSVEDATSLVAPAPMGAVREGWATSTQVNFCAKAYATVALGHPDAPALTVLGTFLRNGHLHRAIREKGGAYGGGAGYDGDTGVFRFYSYRDPRLAETLEDFDRSLEWLARGDYPTRALEEACLGVIGAIDRPDSPAGEAIGAYLSSLYGRTPTQRRDFRARVLQVTIDDLRRVGALYLNPEKASVAVVSDPTTLEREGEKLGLVVRQI
ncbi:presequence protease [Gammaproteobacteria bacterium]